MTYRAADEYEAMFARWHARKELERQQEAEHVQELRADLGIKMAAIERKQSRRRAAHRVVMGLMVELDRERRRRVDRCRPAQGAHQSGDLQRDLRGHLPEIRTPKEERAH